MLPSLDIPCPLLVLHSHNKSCCSHWWSFRMKPSNLKEMIKLFMYNLVDVNLRDSIILMRCSNKLALLTINSNSCQAIMNHVSMLFLILQAYKSRNSTNRCGAITQNFITTCYLTCHWKSFWVNSLYFHPSNSLT